MRNQLISTRSQPIPAPALPKRVSACVARGSYSFPENDTPYRSAAVGVGVGVGGGVGAGVGVGVGATVELGIEVGGAVTTAVGVGACIGGSADRVGTSVEVAVGSAWAQATGSNTHKATKKEYRKNIRIADIMRLVTPGASLGILVTVGRLSSQGRLLH